MFAKKSGPKVLVFESRLVLILRAFLTINILKWPVFCVETCKLGFDLEADKDESDF